MTVQNGSALSLNHLTALMGPHGLFEHARFLKPRVAHGYTTDDNARAVVVTARIPGGAEIFERCLRFVLAGRTDGGWHNRMNAGGRWLDRHGPADTVGRVLWALGVASAGSPGSVPEAVWRHAAAVDLRPLRSVSYAVLGAAAGLDNRETSAGAEMLLARYLPVARRLVRPQSWMWPEDRLTYDNARIPQAMIVAGDTAGNDGLTQRGLDLLAWLIGIEWHESRFAFTPVGGRGPGDTSPGFDQQPIEGWAMADACAVAYRVTGDVDWQTRALAAVEWFAGRNHGERLMFDPSSGAGFDGLHRDGVNQNAGAESTLAYLGAATAGAGLGSLTST